MKLREFILVIGGDASPDMAPTEPRWTSVEAYDFDTYCGGIIRSILAQAKKESYSTDSVGGMTLIWDNSENYTYTVYEHNCGSCEIACCSYPQLATILTKYASDNWYIQGNALAFLQKRLGEIAARMYR